MGYTPQVKFFWWWNSWENIILDSRATSTSDSLREIWPTQKQAEDVIELFKENQKEKIGESIKKTTYINL